MTKTVQLGDMNVPMAEKNGCGGEILPPLPPLPPPPHARRLPLVKPCSRCTVPGVDPASGVRSVATGGVLTKVMRQHRAGGALARSAQLHKVVRGGAGGGGGAPVAWQKPQSASVDLV